MPTFAIGDRDFLLDDRPFQIISGSLHYFRIHPDHWADRIAKAKMMGLNTIETYIAWNFHSAAPGKFETTGRGDIGRFLDLIAEAGLYAIVRPGPYICAEWDNGGLPAWLFTDPEIGVRRHEPRFLAAIGEYHSQLLPILAERQITRGGNILALQVENEYGAYGEDADYLRALVEQIRELGIDVPLLTCDQADPEMLSRGGLPELHKTATFGSRSAERLAILREHQPTGPLMCMEFWDGWFDSWSQPHHRTSPEATAHALDELLAAGASVNIYMLHGGTNFGFTNGANDKGMYLPITTSYDYDAPLSENGEVTEKYRRMRDVISRYAPVPDDMPTTVSLAPAFRVELSRRLPFWDAAPALGDSQSWDHLPTTDEVGQFSGFTLYRTRVTEDDQVLSFQEVRDRALVSIDRASLGVLSRTEDQHTLGLPRAGVLELLVENQGRVNYGPRLGEPKGLIGPARTAGRQIDDWQTVSLELDEFSETFAALLRAADPSDPQTPVAGPTFACGEFDSEAGTDLFLDTSGWGKGLVWINGFLLGRYWGLGPTRTLYLPGPLVRETGNELVVFELHGAPDAVISFVSAPDYGPADV